MNQIVLLVVCLAVLCCNMVGARGNGGKGGKYTDGEYQSHFTDWQRKYNMTYTSDEFQDRFKNFKGHMDFIAAHNSKNTSTFTVGLNQWSGLSSDEFKRIALTAIMAQQVGSDAPVFTGDNHTVRADISLDWRTRGVVNAIKNQAQCGSCWTFSSAAAVESAWAIKTGSLVSLSEQQLLDCTNSAFTCNGGDPNLAMGYIQTAGGIDSEASYPYVMSKGSCRYNPSNSVATVSGYTNVAQTESALLAAVTQQPVAVCIDASLPSFQNYKSGTYSDASCSSTTLNHAIVAIGYGTDTNGDYWLLRNSWGTSWGMSGYFQLARNHNNMCGIANHAAFPSTTGTGAKITPTTSPTTSPTLRPTTPSTPPTISTTGVTALGYIVQNSLVNSWKASGGSINTCATSQTVGKCGVSTKLKANQQFTFTHAVASTSGVTSLRCVVKSSSPTTASLSLGNGAAGSASITKSWAVVDVPLSAMGSPSSISTITITTSNADTLYFDSVYFH